MNTNINNNRPFLPVSVSLLTNPKYRNLDIETIILYSTYESYQHSKENVFTDENGTFIYFPNEKAADIVRVSTRKITRMRKELIDCGLIKVVRNGYKNDKIYVQPISNNNMKGGK